MDDDDEDQHWYAFTSNRYHDGLTIYRYGSLVLAVRHIGLLKVLFPTHNWNCTLVPDKIDKPREAAKFKYYEINYIRHGV